MQTIDAGILAQAQASQNSREYIVDFSDWSGGKKFCGSGIDLDYPDDSTAATYSGRAFALSSIPRGASIKKEEITIEIDDADLYITGLINTADPRDGAVTLTEVWVDPTTRAIIGGIVLMTNGVVASTSKTQGAWSFGLLYASRVNDVYGPSIKFLKNCPKVFKSTTGFACNYIGAETSCDRTWDTCKNTMLNEPYFGGVMWMSRK